MKYKTRCIIQMKKHMIFLIIAAVFLMVALAGCGGEKVEIKLLPKDANLENSRGVIVEPKQAPFNLGGWKKNGEASWTVDVPKAGSYEILIEYSRSGNEPPAHGILSLRQTGKEPVNLKFSAKPTGKDKGDWSVYTINDNCGSQLEKGKLTLVVAPKYNSDYKGTEYFMNLRSITLKLEEK